MIVLWLLAAHLVGDFVFQTRWQATGKFGWSDRAYWLRARHVFTYTLAFVPVAIVYGSAKEYSGAAAFLSVLAILHFLTDAQRFTSTLGDRIVWRFLPERIRELEVRTDLHLLHGPDANRAVPGEWLDHPPPNPWAPLPLVIDQTLHLIQIAVLADVFLT